MSRGPLPLYVEPFRLCDADARLSGRVSAARLERIREFSLGQIDGVDVDLHFRRDEEGRNRIDGTLDAVLDTHCERCLERLSLPLHADIELLVVNAGSSVPETADGLDIVEVEEGRLLLATLVEEEVLLAVPDYPVHEHCEMVGYERGAEGVPAKPEAKENPFDVLAALKKQD